MIRSQAARSIGLAVLLICLPQIAGAAFLLVPEGATNLSKGTRAAYQAYHAGKLPEALKRFKAEAAEGDTTAMFAVAALYEHGKGTVRSLEQAERWYHDAALKGFAPAQYNLGLLLVNQLARQNEGIDWVRRSAEGGWGQAMLQLGRMSLEGGGDERDLPQARSWLLKAANADIPEAHFFLGQIHERGLGVEKDLATALSHYRAASDGDVVDAMLYLGSRYLDGGLGEQAADKALAIYQRGAIELGNGALQFALGDLYETGVAVEQDYHKALSWYKKAASAGYVTGYNKIGFFHEHGMGVKKDEAKALGFYKQGAAAGVAVSKFNIAMMYDAGRGVSAADPVEAARWMYQAAVAGMPLAQNELGVRYQTGKGLMVDMLAAKGWFEASAQAGLAAGQVNLALLHEGESILPRNIKKAADLYFSAARQGHPYGLFRLGQFYEQGIGTKADPVRAQAFYLAAADADYKPAIERRDALAKILTETQLTKAEEWWEAGFN